MRGQAFPFIAKVLNLLKIGRLDLIIALLLLDEVEVDHLDGATDHEGAVLFLDLQVFVGQCGPVGYVGGRVRRRFIFG